MNFLSTLSHDVLFQVFRHLSDKPRSEDWLEHLKADSLRLHVDMNGPFAPCLTNACKSLTLGDRVEVFDGAEESLLVRDGLSIISRILVLLGGSLTNVRWNESRGMRRTDSYFISVLLNRQLSMLQSFYLVGSRVVWTDIVVKHTGTLEKLYLENCFLILPDIPLRELKVLNLMFKGVEDNLLSTFLKTSGGKLEDIRIYWAPRYWRVRKAKWKALIDALRTNCRNVRKICLGPGKHV